MSPLLALFLRRLALAAIALAVLLLVAPRVLRHLGVMGPRPAELVESAARSLEAARTYGAGQELSAYRAAEVELEKARRLLAEGSKQGARKAALQASEQAIAAQRQALARREDERRTGQAVVDEVDRRLNQLEELYAQVTPRLDKATTGRLLVRMKEARQEGAGLILAYEQGNYRKVMDDEAEVRASLDGVRTELLAATR
jgi:hypothetical protein